MSPHPEESVMQERANAVKFKDKMLTLVGPQLKAGDKAPEFTCVNVLDPVRLADTPKKARMLAGAYSLEAMISRAGTSRLAGKMSSGRKLP